MDGQRRIARSLSGFLHCKVGLVPRIMARTGAVMFLGAAVLYGGVTSGGLEYPGSPFARLPAQLASFIGMAADDVNISGLYHHEPEQVLQVIGVRPGGSLVGFNAREAREALRALDWVKSAEVQRVFPNRIEISLVEREPFAIWQIDGQYKVIGRDGVPLSGYTQRTTSGLPLVTGPGANEAASDFINHLSAMPEIAAKMHAAARVGQRRWNLYLDNGVKIALPEKDLGLALEQVAALDAEQNILSKGIREIDLRLAGRLVVALAGAENDKTVGGGQPKKN